MFKKKKKKKKEEEKFALFDSFRTVHNYSYNSACSTRVSMAAVFYCCTCNMSGGGLQPFSVGPRLAMPASSLVHAIRWKLPSG